MWTSRERARRVGASSRLSKVAAAYVDTVTRDAGMQGGVSGRALLAADGKG